MLGIWFSHEFGLIQLGVMIIQSLLCWGVHVCMEANPLLGKLFEHGKNGGSFVAILK